MKRNGFKKLYIFTFDDCLIQLILLISFISFISFFPSCIILIRFLQSFPCQWDALTIVVLGEVTIPPPYEKCGGKEGDALQRVQITV